MWLRADRFLFPVPHVSVQIAKAEWTSRQSESMSRVPLYHQLYSVLKGSIPDGTIGYNLQMPTEQRLAATFDVSRLVL